MALHTEPAWVKEHKAKLARPYTPDEMTRLQAWDRAICELDTGRTWPPGTFQRLLDLAEAEDEGRAICRRAKHPTPGPGRTVRDS